MSQQVLTQPRTLQMPALSGGFVTVAALLGVYLFVQRSTDVAYAVGLLGALLVGVVLHEVMHGAVARALGDRTAERAGRLTLDPRAHLSVPGSLLLLFVGFGWANPVPFDTRNFAHRRLGRIAVALAGPATNAVLFGVLFAVHGVVIGNGTGPLDSALHAAMKINLGLALFNLLPIPPLDGSHLIAAFLPERWERRYQIAGLVLVAAVMLLVLAVKALTLLQVG